MQFWKFALFGVTGDLAHRKILPSLAKFQARHSNEVAIDLIGFSRSEAHEDRITQILNDNSQRNEHKLRSVSFIQSEYDDPEQIKNLIESTDSHQKLFIYLAVPPNVIIAFLQVAGGLIGSNTQIIIEKPFGRSQEEALQIMDVINQHGIAQSIHFIDHYLFKSSVRISDVERENFAELFTRPIHSVAIQALESLGVEDRKGYYDTTGAFKDMFIHLYSLTSVSLNLFDRKLTEFDFVPKKITKGQYDSYGADTEQLTSTNDTYFLLNSTLKPHSKQTANRYNIALTLESGKELGQKRTHITITFKDSSTLEWSISPDHNIVYTSGQDLKQLFPAYGEVADHENMFNDLLLGKMDYFVSIDEVISSWNVYNEVTKLSGFSRLPFKYRNGTYPPKQIANKKKQKVKQK